MQAPLYNSTDQDLQLDVVTVADVAMGAIMDIVVWLRGLGHGKYEAAFRENEIDETVLPNLTHETLRSLASRQLGIASSCSI